MRRRIPCIFGAILTAWAPSAFADAPANLVQNPSFTQAGDAKAPAHYVVKGDAEWVSVGGKFEFAPPGIAFYPWLRKGYLDLDGRLVDEDRLVPDNVVIEVLNDKTMVVHARNLPNHPTAVFPTPPGSGDCNPSYIQEHNYTYFIPLHPVHNPKAAAMTPTNSNRALPMGATGVAINGVVFYNPFDAGMQDAADLMDRCCGHPSPDNRYHYHKYPVCVKSPFADEGDEHSPLIGWAFDGYPIYGPYENKGLMAKDAKDNPLNEFNLHYDEAQGWRYHVTPGKFPYVIGGYWGEVDARNMHHGPGP